MTAAAQTVAALRERLAALGGLARPGARSPQGGAGTRLRADGGAAPAAPARPWRDPPPTDPHRLGRLGFSALDRPEGTAWLRRCTVDLEPHLVRAGADDGVSPADLLGLVPRARDTGGTTAARRVVVLDIETLGLRGSGVVAFLVGLGAARGTRLDVEQLLLVDLGEELPMLAALLERIDPDAVLVTYNGRSFDVPVLRARCVLARVDGRRLDEVGHCDLLGPVRQLFRDRLGSCTLRQAEMSLLGFDRGDDVRGDEAPERYRRFVHRGEVSPLAAVVRHNELDLCATAVLACRLAAHVSGRLVAPAHPGDRYHLARHLERRPAAPHATPSAVEAHLRAAVSGGVAPYRRHAGLRLARRLARLDGDARAEAMEILTGLCADDPHDLRAARALAILAEREGDVAGALVLAERALEACHRLGPDRLGRMRGAPAGGWGMEWEQRRARLALRLARGRRPGTGSPTPPGASLSGYGPRTGERLC